LDNLVQRVRYDPRPLICQVSPPADQFIGDSSYFTSGASPDVTASFRERHARQAALRKFPRRVGCRIHDLFRTDNPLAVTPHDCDQIP
jgi:hypothetical protein